MAKELGFKLLASGVVERVEKNLDQETGCGKEAEDEGGPAVNTSKTQQGQLAKTAFVTSAAVVSVNGHVVEPVEQNQPEDCDRAASDVELKIVNGGSEVRATGEETEASTATLTADDTKSMSDEVNGQTNGALDIATSPSFLNSKGTWADVVSNSKAAKRTGDNNTAVNKMANNITANGVVE